MGRWFKFYHLPHQYVHLVLMECAWCKVIIPGYSTHHQCYENKGRNYEMNAEQFRELTELYQIINSGHLARCVEIPKDGTWSTKYVVILNKNIINTIDMYDGMEGI